MPTDRLTPAPWEAWGKEVIAEITHWHDDDGGKDGTPIAKCLNAADARVMAAALTMLAALYQVRDALDDGSAADEEGREELTAVVHRAIRKAEGNDDAH